jgi:hypothetical protein
MAVGGSGTGGVGVRYAAKVDANHASIVAALRKVGCEVVDLSRVGQGCADLLVRLGFRLKLLEVKRPGGKLNKAQQEWHRRWLPHVCVVETPEQAIEVMTR